MASVNNHENRINSLEKRKYIFDPPYDFISFVIGVISVDNTNANLTSNFIGDIKAYRNNGLFPVIDIHANIVKSYNSEIPYVSYTKIGLDAYSQLKFTPITFIYQNKKYGGFSFELPASCLHGVEIEGWFNTDFSPFLVSYKNIKTNQILNKEINDSIRTNVSYAGAFYHNNKRVWEQGDAITNAVWNDYAERFEKPVELKTEPGDIISLDKTYEKEMYKLAIEGDINIAGVHSDEYGMLIGGTEDEEYNKEHFIPVGMIGRVKTKVMGPIHKGDRIVPSNIAGVGRKFKDGDNIFSIVGYATETNLDENIKKVRVKINTY